MTDQCRITNVHAREVFDSRGKPTVEVEVFCEGANEAGRAIVPSGASTGQFEAVELRDGDPNRLNGDGVRKAVNHVNSTIAQAVLGLNADEQELIDQTLCDLDGTPHKSRLGANAILGVSLACAHAAAKAKRISLVEHLRMVWDSVPRTCPPESVPDHTAQLTSQPRLPLPMVNMISGGLHAGRNLDIQDVLILPVGAESYLQAFEWIVSVYRCLGNVLDESGYEGYLVGDEGGFGPRLTSNRQALDYVVQAIERAGYTPGQQVAIGLDVAATHFLHDGHYQLAAEQGRRFSAEEFAQVLEEWVDRYPIISIEDGLAEEDWSGWRQLTYRLGKRVQLIGDDLFVTNKERLRRGIEENVANGILIKVNQIGTLWETLEAMRLAIDSGYWPVVSARSGETEDATIADLVVATGAGQIKVGSVVRGERLAKYNQLLRIAEELGDRTGYLGGKIFDPFIA
ncbi:MAG: phosphopyruvate hydratase [Planctomycetaceae bacterium]